jgi:hypothetical protein
MHLHGNTFHVTGTEAGRIPQSAWFPGNTVLVGVAQARDVEFDAKYPGDWMFHCHLPHHMMNQMSSNIGPITSGGPMTRAKGMPAGVDMNQGMGLLNGTPGAPMGDDYGASLGRGMGVGSTNDQAVANAPLSSDKGQKSMAGMDMHDISPDASKVPGFPQDAFMEGSMMAMDDMVKKPENSGLPAGWSGFAQGMMTFVRVLPPDQYEQVMQQVQKERGSMPGMRM